MFEHAHASEAATATIGVVSQVVFLPQVWSPHLFVCLPLVLISYFPELTKSVRLESAQQDPRDPPL